MKRRHSTEKSHENTLKMMRASTVFRPKNGQPVLNPKVLLDNILTIKEHLDQVLTLKRKTSQGHDKFHKFWSCFNARSLHGSFKRENVRCNMCAIMCDINGRLCFLQGRWCDNPSTERAVLLRGRIRVQQPRHIGGYDNLCARVLRYQVERSNKEPANWILPYGRKWVRK